MERGNALGMVGDWRGAVLDSTRALGAAGGDDGSPGTAADVLSARTKAMALLNRAVALRMLGALGKSVQDCSAALAVDPADTAKIASMAHQHRSLANRKLGRWRAVEADLSKACP